MNKLFPTVLCLYLCASLLSGCGLSQDDLDEAWEDGHAYGYESGYYTGHEDGYDDGYDDGYFEAESEHEDDYAEGYNEGNNDGYYDGATYACLFYGDVDRAFQFAYEGSAWRAFIYGYDQHISNIYDDDETESELFWSLVSIKSDDGLTAEERNLLISTFGKDLFLRNDIVFN